MTRSSSITVGPLRIRTAESSSYFAASLSGESRIDESQSGGHIWNRRTNPKGLNSGYSRCASRLEFDRAAASASIVGGASGTLAASATALVGRITPLRRDTEGFDSHSFM